MCAKTMQHKYPFRDTFQCKILVLVSFAEGNTHLPNELF